MEKNLKLMNDSEKIMHIVENIFGAKSPESSVTMEMIIDKGIELGLTENYPRGKEDGHPWFPHTSTMMGIGVNVSNREEPHLHREKMKKEGGGSCMHYWVDKTKKHEIVYRNNRVTEHVSFNFSHNIDLSDANMSLLENECPVDVRYNDKLTPEERFSFYESKYPGEYLLVDDKIIYVNWIEEHPDKFKKLYSSWIKTHPDEFKRFSHLYGEV